MKKIWTLSRFLHFLIGIGACFGGVAAMVPSAHESMGVTTELLRYSPFTSFFWPGVFLFFILGIGNLIVGTFSLGHHWTVYLTILLGGILVAWIIIQCIFLWSVTPLHVIFGLLGMIQVISGWRWIRQTGIGFPFAAKQN